MRFKLIFHNTYWRKIPLFFLPIPYFVHFFADKFYQLKYETLKTSMFSYSNMLTIDYKILDNIDIPAYEWPNKANSYFFLQKNFTFFLKFSFIIVLIIQNKISVFDFMATIFEA